jgi:Ran GTPase-activating protein (RanGAP) involved in mRNA processing and transport
LESGNCPANLTLNLTDNNLGPEGAVALATALQSKKCPEHLTLNLTGNNLGPKGAEELAAALQSGNCPEHLTLNLAGNNLGPQGVTALATALQSGNCPANFTLDLGANNLGPKGAAELAMALCARPISPGLTLFLAQIDTEALQSQLLAKIDNFQFENIVHVFNAMHAIETLWPNNMDKFNLVETKGALYPLYFRQKIAELRTNISAPDSGIKLDALYRDFVCQANTFDDEGYQWSNIRDAFTETIDMLEKHLKSSAPTKTATLAYGSTQNADADPEQKTPEPGTSQNNNSNNNRNNNNNSNKL